LASSTAATAFRKVAFCISTTAFCFSTLEDTHAKGRGVVEGPVTQPLLCLAAFKPGAPGLHQRLRVLKGNQIFLANGSNNLHQLQQQLNRPPGARAPKVQSDHSQLTS
jgi:hypothetical protein